MTSQTASAQRSVGGLKAAFVGALLAQVYVLYLYVPGAAETVVIPHADKLVHAAIFALPAALGVIARLRPWLVAAVLAVHAPASEVVQHLWIPARAGDPWDVVADWLGVAVGIGCGLVVARRVNSGADRAR